MLDPGELCLLYTEHMYSMHMHNEACGSELPQLVHYIHVYLYKVSLAVNWYMSTFSKFLCVCIPFDLISSESFISS